MWIQLSSILNVENETSTNMARIVDKIQEVFSDKKEVMKTIS